MVAPYIFFSGEALYAGPSQRKPPLAPNAAATRTLASFLSDTGLTEIEYAIGEGLGLRARFVRLRPAGAGADQDGPQLWKARTAIRTSAQHPGDVGKVGQLVIDDGTLQCAEADRKADADDRPRIGLGGTCRHSTNKGDSDARLNGSTKPLRDAVARR